MTSTPPTPSLSRPGRARLSTRLGGTLVAGACLAHPPGRLLAAGTQFLAQTAGVESLRKLFGAILYLVMAVGLIFGVIKVIQGALALTQGEEGWGQIIGGAMIAAAPTIMVFAFNVGGMGGVAIQPGDIKPTP